MNAQEINKKSHFQNLSPLHLAVGLDNDFIRIKIIIFFNDTDLI